MSTDFDLDAIVRDVLSESNSNSLEELAATVFLRIPKDQHGRILARLLRSHVREIIRKTRMHSRAAQGGSTVTPIGSSRSAKVAGIRAGWQRRLDELVHTGEGNYTPLAACTYADLLYAADERQQAAERTLVVAASYRRMAEAVKAAGVETFGDLPDDAQAEVLGAA